MNWNGQRQTLEHLISLLLDPDRSASIQRDFNAKRRARVESALNARPLFIPLLFSMNAAGQISPYRDTTPSLSYPVIITGIKSDSKRKIVIRRTEDEKPITYIGEETNLFLTADEIAGQTVDAGGGQQGTFYFPEPIILPAGNRLTIEMYKDDTTPDPENANITLIGIRVFNREYASLLLDAAERNRIDSILQMREVPRVVFLKVRVNFDSALAGGEARNIYTPQVEEPLLVRGIRTTLRHSLISLKVQGEPTWTVSPTPIWAVAGEDDLGHENYQWFSKPVFLHSKNQIEIERIVNAISGSSPLDPQNDNTITFICQTV